MDYSVYDTADFVCDDSFLAWVKYGENGDFWETVAKQYPQKATELLQARAIILAAGQLPAYTFKQEAAVWNNIQAGMTTPEVPVRRRSLTRWYWAAAIFASIVCTSLWQLLPLKQREDSTYRHLKELARVDNKVPVEAVNDGDKPMAVSLPDGSSVLLQPGSRLSYPACFSRTCHRKVYLSGAAFFEVSRITNQPFVVYANEMVINVLGTSFGIKANEYDSTVRLIVKTGKVAVSIQRKSEQVIVNASQQAVLQRKTLLVAVTLLPADQPVITNLETAAFIFNDAPVDSVMNAITRAYGVHITYDKTLLADCRLTASLTDEPLNEKIRLICKALEATCIIEGNNIKISAKGCHNKQ